MKIPSYLFKQDKPGISGRLRLLVLSLCMAWGLSPSQVLAQCAGIDSVRFTNVTCFGTATGTVTVYASPGTPPYTYLLQRLTGTGFVLAGTSFGNPSTIHTFTGLVAGNNYFVTVADDDPNCSAVISAFFNITQPPNLVLNLSSRTNVNGCFGDSTGSITVAATGGTAPYQFNLNGGAFGASNTFSNLGAGSYTIGLRDQNNCTRNLVVNITQPAAVNLSVASQTNVSCFNAATGAFSVSTTGGAAPYQYSFNGGAFSATSTFNDLAAGNYTVIVRDSAGCRDTVQATIIQPASGVTLTLDSSANISCNGASDGRLHFSAANGALPYAYSINGSPFAAASSFTGLAPGSYTVIVRDNGNCTDTVQATLSQPPALDLSTTSVVDNLCFGDNSGAITLSATGGTPAYTFALNAGVFGPGNSFTSLGSGSYVARVRDARGCTDTLVVNINPPTDLQVITGAVVNVACFGQNSGSFSVTGTGGTAPYQFAFQNGAFGTINSFSGLAAGTYRIRIQDANLCQDSLFVSITQPASALDITVGSQVNPNCFGASNGSIQVNALGGTAPYQFSINGGAFAASGNFTGLIAGNYLIRTRDANNCTDSVSVTLNQPALLDITLAIQTNVACFGESNGSVQLNGSGGTAPYAFALNSGAFQASGNFTGLSAGSYTARIQDANGCTDTLVFNITAPPALNLNPGPITQVQCFGAATGSFSVIASGGQAPYTYSLNGSAFGPSSSFSSLAAGAYTVVVRDANTCTDTLSVSITQPASALDISVNTQVNISCFGQASGSISVSGSGGVAPYQYSLNGAPFAAGNSFTNLPAGNYSIRIRDVNFCLDSVVVNLSQPASALTLGISTQVNVTCNGGNNGSLQVSAGGGSAPYLYSLNGAAFQASPLFNALAAGNYQVVARDANGCQDTVLAIISQPAELVLSIGTQTNNLCFGESNGTVNLSATGGSAPYQYSLGTGSFGPSSGFSGLAAGSYVARVRDANLCVDSIVINITQPTDLSLSTGIITQVACFGSSTGAFTVSGAGGVSPYQYSLNGAAFSTNSSFSGLSAGPYRVVVRDANNCLDSINVNITQPAAALDISLGSQTNPGCFGLSNGSITVNGSGGTAPYTFSLNAGPFAGASTFSSLAAGNYQVVIRDANACTDTLQVLLTQPTAVDVQVLTQVNNLCFNDNSGSISLSGSGGTAPYTFALNSGAFGASSTFSSLTAGNYIGRVQDSNGCRDSINITLTAPAELVATITSQTNVACFGQSSGAFSISATGGTAPYSYSLNGGPFSATSSFNNLSAGSYTLVARDAGNCTDTLIVNLTQPASAVDLSLQSRTDVLCFGQSSGNISLSASGGTAPYFFSLNGGSFQASGVFNALAAGTYSLIARDANACQDTLNVSIAQPSSALDLSLNAQVNVVCFGDSSGSFSVNASGGTAPYQFSLNGAAFAAASSFSNLSAGNYQVVVRDGNACTDTLQVVITQPGSALAIAIGTQVNVNCSGGNGGLLVLTGTGGTSPYQFSLNGGPFQASGTFAGLTAGVYNLVIRDANNCQSGATAIITEPTALSLSIASQVNVACFGGNTGSVTASASGGTAPYQYSFNGSAFGSVATFGGLAAGSYNLVVRDANNCQVNQLVNISQPASALSLSIASQTNVLCHGASTGSVSLNASGGTAPYSYSIDGTNFVPGSTFSSLAFGSYTLRVRDANNCLSTVNVNISQPASPISFTATGINPSTCTSTDGQIVVSGTLGGTAPYSYSIDGVNFTAASTFTGLGNGTFFVFVRDANNCTVNNTVSIASPGTITALATTDSADCFGGSDGSISLSGLSGGNGNYSFSLNGGPFQTLTSFNGLTAGLYTVTVRDNPTSCSINLNVQVREPNDLQINLVSQSNNTCRGGNEGQIQVNGSGGTAPYSYAIQSGAFGSVAVFDSLMAGTYTLRIRDSRGCEDSLSVNITEPSTGVSLSATSVVGLNCQGDSTGSITVSATGGTSPYTFALNSGTFSASNTFNQLTAGNYLVTARDVNGCDTSINVSISAPSPLVLSVVAASPVTCFGGANGRIEVTATGGTAPYSFAINSGAFAAGSVFNGLTAGNYQIRVRDANNCEALQNVSISQPVALAFLVNANVNPGCFGDSVWSVSFSPLGGTAPYTFRFLDTVFSAQTSFASVLPGFYFVTIRDSNACELTSPLFLPNPYTPININVTSTTQVLCHGDSSGSISVNATGGVGGYEFSMNGGSFQSSGVFTQLPAGTYNLVARDSFGCIAQTTVNISQPSAPVSFDVNFSNPSTCSSNDGSISLINVSGGVSPYSYSLGGGTFVAGSTFNGLGNGSYLLFVRDANSCTTAADTVILSSPGGLSATISSGNVSCFGGNNGSISISGAAGGNGNFQYSLNGGPFGASSSFTGLIAGAYTVVVRDSPFTCEITLNANITQPDSLNLNISSSDVLCFDEATGQLTATAAGGTAPYTFSLNSGPFSASANFSGLSAGTYTLTLRDANNCEVQRLVAINQPGSALTATFASLSQVACFGDSSGAVSVNASGGTAPYSYSLLGSPFVASNTFSGLAAGNYTLTVRDANNCDTTLSFSITAPAQALSLSVASVGGVNCFGDNNGSVSLTANGGTAPYQFSFNGGPFVASASFTGLSSGTFTAVLRDANACTDSFQVTIPGPLAPVNFTVNAISPTSCTANDGSIGFTGLSGGTPPYRFSIDGGTNFSANASFTSLGNGTYFVQVRDSLGCSNGQVAVLNGPGALTATVNTSPVTCHATATGAISISGVSGGNGNYLYSINGGAFQTAAVFNGLTAGSYIIQVRDQPVSCTITLNAVVTQPSALSLNVLQQLNPTCAGLSNGLIEVQGIGGNPGYRYSINGGASQSSGLFNSLGSGTYSILLIDSNLCEISIIRTLSSPAGLTLTASSIVPVACHGDSSAQVNLSMSGGIAPYSFSFNGTVFQAGSSFSNLMAGNYTFTVRDSANCTATLPLNISQPAQPLQIGVVVTSNVLCFGANSGAFNATASGGVAPYEFRLNSGGFVPTGNFSNLPSGTYTVTVRDASGCQSDTLVVITGPTTGVTFNTTGQNPSSCAVNDGQVRVLNPLGGVGPYQFSLGGINYGSDSVFSNLGSGTYALFVRDANGCVAGPDLVSIAAPGGLSALITGEDPLCPAQANGVIRVRNLSGGSGQYRFSLNGAAAVSDSTFTGLAAGLYTLVVTDTPASCSSTFNVVLSAPDSILISLIAQQNARCVGDSSGSFSVQASGGTGPYLYALNSGPAQANGSFSGLPAGTYSVTATDSLGCSQTFSVSILNQPGSGSISLANVIRPSCFGAGDGSLSYTVTGSAAPYTFSINGGPFSAQSSFTGLSAGLYLLTVLDSNNCVLGRTDILTQPDTLSISALVSNAVGCGSSSGRLIVNASGGTAPYRYSLNGGPLVSNDTFSALAPGIYSVQVVDSLNCSNTRSFVINASGTITGSVFQTPVLCNGVANGQALVFNVTGGSGSYQYSINGVQYQPSPLFSNLALGPYLVYVRDAADTLCVSTFPINVAAQFTVSGLVVVTGSSCTAADGQIEFSISGGTAPYQYSVDSGVNFSPANIFNGLGAGVYHLVVRDANNCTFTRTVNLPGAPVIQPFASIGSALTCANSPNAAIRVDSVSGSAGPFLYSIDGVNFVASNLFVNLSADTFVVRVQDIGSGCVATDTLIIYGPEAIDLQAQILSDAGCAGASNGVVGLSASGGIGSYLFSLDTGLFISDTLFSGLGAGSYLFKVSDSVGCRDSVSITLNPSDTIQVQFSSTGVSTCNAVDGTIQVQSVTGGTAPYRFSLNGAPASTQLTFNGLAAGTYQITVFDTANCSRDFNVIVPSGSGLSAQAFAQSTSCRGSATGAIRVQQIAGGLAPYQYSIDSINFQLDSSFNGLAAGNYRVVVRSADSCQVVLLATVIDPDTLLASVNFVKNVTCREANDGILDLNASGGTPGYRFSIDGVNYQNSDLFVGLGPQSDTAFVQDSAGCIASVPFSIGQPDSVSYTMTITPANTCNAATGTATINSISGGLPPYQLSINGGTTFSDSTEFPGLSNGSYTLIIRDSLGCLYTSQFVISVPGGLTLGISQMIQPTCFGSNNGEIRIGNISGGARPYQFSIDGGISFGNDSVFTNLVSFVYSVVIRDANNCTYTYIYNLGQPSNINFNVNQQQPATCDSANGSVIITNVVGGITPYSYKIDYNGSAFQPSPVFTGLPGGNYQVTVRDATGVCEVTKLVVVAGNPGITFDFEVTDALCFGGGDGEVRLFNIQGGLPPYRAGLDTAQNYVVIDQTNSVTFGGLSAGNYQYQIRDEDGCTYKLPEIIVGQPDSIGFTVRNVQLSRRDSAEGVLYVYDIIGGAEPYRYSVDGINYLPFDYSLSTFEYTAMIKNLRVGNYTVFVQDTNGCINAARVAVLPYQFAGRFEIPNVFTPNGDGFNETFVINRLPSNSKLKIYARNGRLVYSSDDYANDWDGDGWPNGVYFYAMTVPNLGDFVGWVEIKR